MRVTPQERVDLLFRECWDELCEAAQVAHKKQSRSTPHQTSRVQILASTRGAVSRTGRPRGCPPGPCKPLAAVRGPAKRPQTSQVPLPDWLSTFSLWDGPAAISADKFRERRWGPGAFPPGRQAAWPSICASCLMMKCVAICRFSPPSSAPPGCLWRKAAPGPSSGVMFSAV